MSSRLPGVPTNTADADSLITTFGRLVEVEGRLERRLGADLEARCGLPHAWFEVLVRLSRSEDGQLTMGALAEQVTLTTGGVTRLVDRLASAGLVTRLPCPTDRRVAYAAITDEGRAKLDEAAAVHAANLREVFGDFTDRELALLDRLLDRLRAVPSHV
jgi:MarR family transcriptional regulator, 2-MHQ and catechol-resistance regulon repressor